MAIVAKDWVRTLGDDRKKYFRSLGKLDLLKKNMSMDNDSVTHINK